MKMSVQNNFRLDNDYQFTKVKEFASFTKRFRFVLRLSKRFMGSVIFCSYRKPIALAILCRRTLACSGRVYSSARYHVSCNEIFVSLRSRRMWSDCDLLSRRHLHHVDWDRLDVEMIVAPEKAKRSRLQDIHFMRPVELNLNESEMSKSFRCEISRVISLC